MKVRIKFSKTGSLRFIGHLDLMRYFQKLMRRADIPIAYSEGFSPHQIMSFAMPLGIGLYSVAEYLDIELLEKISSRSAIDRLNASSVDEIRILSFKELPENALKAMASISAADYTISFREGHEAGFKLREAFEDLYMKDEILVSKRSKKSCRELDIKPYIYAYDIKDDSLSLRLSCGSVMNIKPELVMEALYDLAGFDFNEYALIITRTELYSGDKDSLVPLDDTGLEITMTEDGPFALS